MLRGRRFIAAMLVVAVLVAGMPVGPVGRAQAAEAPAVVLPAGQELDDQELQEVTGNAGPLAAAAAVAVKAAAAWVGVKVAESAWNNVIEPALDKYVWQPIRDRLDL